MSAAVSSSEIQRLEALVWLALQKAAAAAIGPAAGEIVTEVPFTFASASPIVLHSLLPGQVVNRVAVLIETAFDGAGAAVKVGTVASPGLMLAPGDVGVTHPATYETSELFPALAPAVLQLTITPGAGATQGAGVVLVKIK